jgi:putative oxidoreductase
MLQQLLQTGPDYVCLFLRVVAGIIIFPYGMQKLFGWFEDLGGGVGIKGSLKQLAAKKIPLFLGWLIIIGQSLGSIALITGCLGRVAAGANFIIFTGALIVHAPDGWTMNWLGKKKGEGIEYFIMLLSILLVIIIKGSGAFSVDLWLWTQLEVIS